MPAWLSGSGMTVTGWRNGCCCWLFMVIKTLPWCHQKKLDSGHSLPENMLKISYSQNKIELTHCFRSDWCCNRSINLFRLNRWKWYGSFNRWSWGSEIHYWWYIQWFINLEGGSTKWQKIKLKRSILNLLRCASSVPFFKVKDQVMELWTVCKNGG